MMKKRSTIVLLWIAIIGFGLFLAGGCREQIDQTDQSKKDSEISEEENAEDASDNTDTAKDSKSTPSFVVILDPGHGGPEKGRQAFGYNEKDLNNQLTEKIARELEAREIAVKYTQHYSEDYYLSLSERMEIANDMDADLFISIHHDGSIHTEARGVSVFYSTYRPVISFENAYLRNKDNGAVYDLIGEVRNQENRKDYVYINAAGEEFRVDPNDENFEPFEESPSREALLSKALAGKIAEALVETGLWDRGPIDDPYYVARRSVHPAVLIEAGFMTNEEDIEDIVDPIMQQKRAEAVAEAVHEFLLEEFY